MRLSTSFGASDHRAMDHSFATEYIDHGVHAVPSSLRVPASTPCPDRRKRCPTDSRDIASTSAQLPSSHSTPALNYGLNRLVMHYILAQRRSVLQRSGNASRSVGVTISVASEMRVRRHYSICKI